MYVTLNNHMKSGGFSLIELMVVIAIVGILAAVAVPSYRDYILRSKIIGSYTIMRDLRQKIIEKYQTDGAWPSTIEFAGTTLVDNSWHIINVDPIKTISYHVPAGATGVYISVSLTGLTGITGFIEPGTTYSAKSVLREATYEVNGVFKTHCGMWSPTDTNDVPAKYQPSNCDCTNMNASYSGNPTC